MQDKQMIFKVMPPTWAQSAMLEPLDHTLDILSALFKYRVIDYYRLFNYPGKLAFSLNNYNNFFSINNKWCTVRVQRNKTKQYIYFNSFVIFLSCSALLLSSHFLEDFSSNLHLCICIVFCFDSNGFFHNNPTCRAKMYCLFWIVDSCTLTLTEAICAWKSCLYPGFLELCYNIFMSMLLGRIWRAWIDCQWFEMFLILTP